MVKAFLRVNEAAKVFSVGRNLLYRAIHNGELKAYKPNGRDFLLKASDIEAWVMAK